MRSQTDKYRSRASERESLRIRINKSRICSIIKVATVAINIYIERDTISLAVPLSLDTVQIVIQIDVSDNERSS